MRYVVEGWLLCKAATETRVTGALPVELGKA
jgi:hypothetical protein